MRWGPLLLCSWPGLPGLWCKGHWSSLFAAVGFAILLNIALVSSFLWKWSLGEAFPLIAWPVICLIWAATALVSYNRLTDLVAVPTTDKVAATERPDTLFIQAQHEYLKGHWGEAKTLLKRQIDQHPRDIESRLLLATLFRHSRQLDQSLQQLKEIKRFDEAVEWNFECEREEELIREIISTQDEEKLEHSLTIESNNKNEWSDAA